MLPELFKNIAKSSFLLKSLPPNYQELILKFSQLHSYQKGEKLFLQGDPAQSIKIVIEGWVKISRVAPSGDEVIVDIFREGDSFGEAVVFHGANYPVTATAISECKILSIPRTTLLDALSKEPEVVFAVMGSIFGHLHSLISQLHQLKALNGTQRVARFLLDLCKSDSGKCVVTLPFDKLLIAGKLGMKPESLSRSFSRLKKIGVQIEHNHATISDVSRLRSYTDKSSTDGWEHKCN